SDVANGYQIWSERYDRDIRDIFNVQDEIAKTIAERLRVTLGSDPGSIPHVVRHTQDMEAYHLYLRGRHHWYTRSKGALQKALGYFDEAARRDPNYALAHVGLAEPMKALDIDSNYLVALYLIGGAYTHAGRHEEALASFEKALKIAGRESFYVAHLAWAQAMAGHRDDARRGLADIEARAPREYV